MVGFLFFLWGDVFRGSYILGGLILLGIFLIFGFGFFYFFGGLVFFFFWVVGFFGDFLLSGVFVLSILNCFYSFFGNSLDFCAKMFILLLSMMQTAGGGRG